MDEPPRKRAAVLVAASDVTTAVPVYYYDQNGTKVRAPLPPALDLARVLPALDWNADLSSGGATQRDAAPVAPRSFADELAALRQARDQLVELVDLCDALAGSAASGAASGARIISLAPVSAGRPPDAELARELTFVLAAKRAQLGDAVWRFERAEAAIRSAVLSSRLYAELASRLSACWLLPERASFVDVSWSTVRPSSRRVYVDLRVTGAVGGQMPTRELRVRVDAQAARGGAREAARGPARMDVDVDADADAARAGDGDEDGDGDGDVGGGASGHSGAGAASTCRHAAFFRRRIGSDETGVRTLHERLFDEQVVNTVKTVLDATSLDLALRLSAQASDRSASIAAGATRVTFELVPVSDVERRAADRPLGDEGSARVCSRAELAAQAAFVAAQAATLLALGAGPGYLQTETLLPAVLARMQHARALRAALRPLERVPFVRMRWVGGVECYISVGPWRDALSVRLTHAHALVALALSDGAERTPPTTLQAADTAQLVAACTSTVCAIVMVDLAATLALPGVAVPSVASAALVDALQLGAWVLAVSVPASGAALAIEWTPPPVAHVGSVFSLGATELAEPSSVQWTSCAHASYAVALARTVGAIRLSSRAC